MADDVTMETLAVEFTADLGPLEREMDRGQQFAFRRGEQMALGFSEQFRRQLRSAFGGGGVISEILFGGGDLYSARALFRGFGDLTEFVSQAGASIGYYRRQLTGLAGDSRVAEAALKRVQDIAANSNFDTPQVLRIATVLSGRTGNLTQASAETGQIVDAAAKLGIENKQFERFAVNLEQIMAKQQGKVDERDVRELRTYAPAIALEISRALGISQQQANQMLDTGTGKQLYDALLKIGQQNKGYAATAAANDPASVLANMVDDTRNALAPTGEAFNRAAVPVLMTLRQATSAFGELNQATGGSAGLAIMAGVATAGVLTLRTGLTHAATAVNVLSAAVNNLAGSSERAAVASGIAAAETAAGGTLLARGVGAVFAGAGGLLARAGSLARGAAGFGVPLALELAGGTLQQNKSPFLQGLGGMLSSAGTFGGIGAMIGSVIPGVGTLIGAGVGTTIGLLAPVVGDLVKAKQEENRRSANVAAVLNTAAGHLSKASDNLNHPVVVNLGWFGTYDSSTDKLANPPKDNRTTAIEKNTRAVEMNSEALKLMDKQFGGGDRSRFTSGLIEREYAALHLWKLSTGH